MNEDEIVKGKGLRGGNRLQRPSGARDQSNDGSGVSGEEHVNFSFSHRHSGLHGDGRKITVGSLDTSIPFVEGDGPVFLTASGTKYRLTVVEVIGDDGSLCGAIELVPVD